MTSIISGVCGRAQQHNTSLNAVPVCPSPNSIDHMPTTDTINQPTNQPRQGFPTIKFFYVSGGKIKSSSYQGGRSAKELVSFALDKVGFKLVVAVGFKMPIELLQQGLRWDVSVLGDVVRMSGVEAPQPHTPHLADVQCVAQLFVRKHAGSCLCFQATR